MLKSGNGKPERCVENLMHIVQGEIPYDRVRGINPSIIDKPSNVAIQDMEQEAIWNVENYEPRVDIDEISVSAEVAENGAYSFDVQVNETEEENE